MSEPRVPYFERPAPPHDWRRNVALLGRSFITLGLLMFGFVAYQLWGTGIQTAQAQHTLDRQFAAQLAGTTTSATTTPSTTAAGPSSSTANPTPSTTTLATATTTTLAIASPSGAPPSTGTAVARLKITSIDLTYTVVQGVGVADLKKGPGHFPETPMPGQYGNAAIAGHRTTYGHPFYRLDKVRVGDLIEVDTLVGKYVYQVTGNRVVEPSQYDEVIPTVDPKVATLTLATCTPAYTAQQRLIVFAQLVPEQSSQVYEPSAPGPPSAAGLPGDAPATTAPVVTQPGGGTSVGGPTTTIDAAAPTTTNPSTTTTTTTTTTTPSPTPNTAAGAGAANDAFASGWFDDASAIPHVLTWGSLLFLVGAIAYVIGRRFRRLWVCFVVGAVPFLVVLYFFFENVNRLLPSSI